MDEGKLMQEVAEKRQKLLNFTDIKKTILPKEVKADLRPYQKESFNWLNFLDEFGWGGCLADDMGLGKTVQVLTFLRAQIKKHPKVMNLVVVPTSLVFNWEREIQKFTPDVLYYIHWGTQRMKDAESLEGTQILITTYGTLANDIDFFKDLKFNYAILDESQAIKNPESQRYKAVRLIQARNRLVMTGTPVENNTFDLYAQMTFLNPGFLGSMASFKEYFSTPIDKFADQEAAIKLQKLIKPFILRRTKEQVATDLPEKTESIIYCVMGAKQRKVYEAFRDDIREKLLKKIDEEGINNSGMYILDGMLKLRQICDSPKLIKTEADFGSDSVKLDELMDNVLEKTGNHKILIFSQFVEMLKLIEEKMQHHRIKYE
jgi:SNF2 family DNA or RNA helicase